MVVAVEAVVVEAVVVEAEVVVVVVVADHKTLTGMYKWLSEQRLGMQK